MPFWLSQTTLPSVRVTFSYRPQFQHSEIFDVFYPLRNVSLTFYEGKSEDGMDGGTLITTLSPAPLKSYS